VTVKVPVFSVEPGDLTSYGVHDVGLLTAAQHDARSFSVLSAMCSSACFSVRQVTLTLAGGGSFELLTQAGDLMQDCAMSADL